MTAKTGKILIGIGVVSFLAFLVKNEIAKNTAPKIYLRKLLPGGYNAQTIPPFGIFINESEKDNEMLLKHELIHWEQYKRLGLLRYYFEYADQINEFGYDKMPLEIEARVNEESEWVKNNYTEAVRDGHSQTVYNPEFRKI